MINNKLLIGNILFVIMFLIISSFFVSAGLFSKDKEVWMSVNQSEYYVLLNAQGEIPLEINNDFDTSIDSLFTFTITSSINQGNLQSTTQNIRTKTMTAAPKKQTIPLGVGPSQSDGQIQIDITLSYTDPKTNEQKTSTLNGIIVHFINMPQDNQSQQQSSQKNSQQKNTNQEKRSTSQTQNQNSQTQNSQNQNMMQQLQQQLQQMQNANQNQQIPSQSQSQQALQNNQASSDMNALKQQMQQQQQLQQEQENQFKQNLAKNQDFLNENQKLEQQGYKLQSLNTQADSNNSGKFNAEYKNDLGETAQMQGEMNNNGMQNIQSQTQKQRDAMRAQMMNSSKYKNIDKMLQQNGYNFSNLQYGALNPVKDNNNITQTKTTVTATYVNKNNETVQVNADFVNYTLKKVDTDFKKDNHNNLFWWILLITIFVMAVIGGFLYYKSKKKKSEDVVVEDGVKEILPFDYMYYCKKELESAKRLFEDAKDEKNKGHTKKDEENKKEAYAKCANALRVFYSHKFADKSEIVNADALKIAKKHKFHNELLNDTLNLCMLVEFAKYKPNSKDFNEIYKNSKKIIEKQNEK